MTTRPAIHIEPRDGGWARQKEGTSRAGSVHTTKAEAEAAGRKQAQREHTELIVKREDGTIERLHHSDLDAVGALELGATVGALIGFGAAGEEGIESGMEAGAIAIAEQGGHVIDPDDVWYVEDAIPPGSAAAIALIEHQWAIGLRESIRNAGGRLLDDHWIHPADLVAIGLLSSEEGRAGA